MDLKSFKSTDELGVWMTVTDPMTSEDTDARIKIAGNGSRKMKSIDREMVDAMIHAIRGKTKSTGKTAEDKALKKACACVIGWENIEWDGALLDCTPENVATVLADPEMYWLVQQVNAWRDEDANFISISAPSSRKVSKKV